METEDWSSGILSNSGNEKPDMLLYFIIGLDGELNYSIMILRQPKFAADM